MKKVIVVPILLVIATLLATPSVTFGCGGCRQAVRITTDNQCFCPGGECAGSIKQTSDWYCEEYGEGCPEGEVCRHTCLKTRWRYRYYTCTGECETGSDCIGTDPEYHYYQSYACCKCQQVKIQEDYEYL